MLDSYTSSMCIESLGRSSFARCLIEINADDVLKESLTMSVPLIEGLGFIIEIVNIEYEWKPPRYDLCKIFGHVQDHCPKKASLPPSVDTLIVEKTNDGFQTVGKKKKKGKSKSTNGGQFGGHSVKQNVRYEPKATANVPMKGAMNTGNASKSGLSQVSTLLKNQPHKVNVPPTKDGNITMSNSYVALDDESKEEIKNVYDESTNVLISTKTGGSSSTFTVAVEVETVLGSDGETTSALELLRKIRELEQQHAHIKQEISKRLAVSQLADGALDLGGVMDPFAPKPTTESKYLNIMQSVGHAIHVYDRELKIIFWNRAAENLYGYTVAEVCGKNPTDLLVEAKVAMYSNFVLKRTVDGESWSGSRFPVKNKRGERFVVSGTNTPLRNENRRLIGAICISSDDCPYHVIDRQLTASRRLCLDYQQASIGSFLSSLASKAKLKTKTDETYTNDIGAFDLSDDAHQNESSSPRAHTDPSPFGVFYPMDTAEDFTESENKLVFSNILSLKVKTWIGKKRTLWPWKGTGREIKSFDTKVGPLGWDQLDVKQENNPNPQLSSSASEKLDCQLYKNFNMGSNKTRSSGLLLSTSHASSTSSTSSGGMSIQSHAIIKHGNQTDNLNYEILSKDLITREKIGQGSWGTYITHCGMDQKCELYMQNVAVKLFACQEYSDDVILSFELEVSMMKRLRHPNILLFMGAVTSPQHLCIVTEFLPRGSLFRVLQRDTLRLDWKHRLHLAIDIARGMNYLHHCNPPIFNRDLKSSNLLVNKNWTVKPQWMAPEALRNEYADEKSDVYSYGVVLWELTTEKIPWADLDIMQVIEAVGFMNQRLEIPKDVDREWASLIESCWCSEPQSRPTFQEILSKLKDLQKKFATERRR
ncbi:PAC motif-containing protein [Tanacetum coccineum]